MTPGSDGDDADLLSPDDARILSMESPTITGHTLKLVVLEPGSAAIDLAALRASVAARLATQPRAMQRADTSGAQPRWVPAAEFDISHHVRRHDGSGADLWQTVSALMAQHLDRRRPLWSFDVIGPLADGREAIAVRIHHAMADGIAAVRFLHAVLWDEQPEPSAREHAPGAGPPQHAGTLGELWRMPGALRRELGHRGSASPFDRPLSGARELAFTVAPLADMKAIGATRPVHATVNDVLLAVISGGLRDWLGSDAAAGEHLRAQIPVSLHHRDEDPGAMGNRDSFINVDLPIAVADPLARLDLISSQTRTRKNSGDAVALYDLFHALGRTRHVASAVQRFAGSAREFSVAISNVPGPPVAVAVAGRPVAQLFSSSEPGPHHVLRISAISCAGEVGIGLCTDPQALPGITGLAAAIDDSYAQLREAVEGSAGD